MGERLVADLYEFGHAIEGALWAGQYRALEAIDWSLQPISGLSDLGTVWIVGPGPRIYMVDFTPIGTVAGNVDLYAGSWINSQLIYARERMNWHWAQQWQYGNMVWTGPRFDNYRTPLPDRYKQRWAWSDGVFY